MGANCANKAKQLGSVTQSRVVLNYEDNEDFYRGKNYESCGKYDVAAEYYQKSLLKNPYSPNAKIGLGNCSFQKGKYQKQDTIKYYRDSIQLDQNAKFTYIGLGNVYAYDQDFQRAITYYEGAISIDPNFSQSYNGLGNLYTFMGDHKSAMKNFTKATRCEPSNGFFWLNLACSQIKRGNHKQSVFSYLKGKSWINSSDPQLTENQKNLIATKINEFEKLIKMNNIHYEDNSSNQQEKIKNRQSVSLQTVC